MQTNFGRVRDPETFFFLALLKQMQRNPNANVTKEIEKIMISESPKDYGDLKPLLYRKWNKYDHDKAWLKKSGLI